MERAVQRPMDPENRWAWVFQVWVLVGLAWIVRAKARQEGLPEDVQPSDVWKRDLAVALGVSTQLLNRAIAVGEGREPLLGSLGGLGSPFHECEALALPAVLALLLSQPQLREVLLRAILRRCLFLLGEQARPSFQTLSERIVRPMVRALRAELAARAGNVSAAAAAEIRDETARLRKALVRVLAVVVVGQRQHWLGPDLAECLPVTLLVPLIQAEASVRTRALERVRGALEKSLPVERIRRALKEGLGSPGSPKPRNPITEQCKQQQEFAAELDGLDGRLRQGGLAVTVLLVPTALVPGRAERSDARLHPWRPTKEWWRLAGAHTERVQRELIPALHNWLWPILAAGG